MNPCRLFLVCALVGLAIPALLARQNESPVDWVRSNAIRLATAEAGRGFVDLNRSSESSGTRVSCRSARRHTGRANSFNSSTECWNFLSPDGLQYLLHRSQHAGSVPAERLRVERHRRSGATAPRHVFLDVGHRGGADHDPVDARVQSVRGRGASSSPGSTCRRRPLLQRTCRRSSRNTSQSIPSVAEAMALATRASAAAAARAFGVATASFPIAPAAGRKVRYSGFIKTEGVATRVCGSVVACRRPLWCSGVRQYADPRRDRLDGLGALRDRGSRRCRCEEHQLRGDPAG